MFPIIKFSSFIFSQDRFFVNSVLLPMLRFAEQMSMDPETSEIALECYTELLDLLDFMHLPGVLLRKAECLLDLVKNTFTNCIVKHCSKDEVERTKCLIN